MGRPELIEKDIREMMGMSPKKNLIKKTLDILSPKIEYKWWRTDRYVWEEKITYLGIFSYYRLSIRKGAKLKVSYTILRGRNPIYIKKAIQTTVYIGKKEFMEKYKGNRYSVPVNLEIDLNIP